MVEQNTNAVTSEKTAKAAEETSNQKILVVDDVCVVSPGETPNNLNTPIIINRPESGETLEVPLHPGQKYTFNFAEDEVQSFVQQDGNLHVHFNDGSVIILEEYESISKGPLPATLAFSDTLTPEELAGQVQVIETVPDQEELQEPQSEVRKEQLGETEDTQQGESGDGSQVAAIQPAAGNEKQTSATEKLASIEPAAGETTAQGPQNSGFTFSDPDITPVGPIDDVGPINPTALQYGVDFRNDELLPLEQAPPNDIPSISPSSIGLDETNLGPLSQSGVVVVNFGADGPGTITPNGSFTPSGSLAGGSLTSGGQPVTVTPTAGGYEGTLPGGAKAFTLVLDPATGAYTFEQLLPLDHADGSNPNDIITLDFGVTARDSNGDTSSTTITVSIADDAPATAAPDENTINESALSAGPIVINDTLIIDFGQDKPGNVSANGSYTVDGVANLTSGGQPVTITPTVGGYEGTLPGGATAFTLALNPATGAYTFTQILPLDHAPGNTPISLTFGAQITDFDGDSTNTTIKINILDDNPDINDLPTVGHGIENIDESNLTPLNTSGTLNIDFGADGPGAITPNGAFTPSGSLAGGSLTSGGQPITVTQTADGYVGTLPGGATVFTLQVNPATGAYTFTQLLPLDHADGSNPNDVITLDFGVTATDGDGDTDTGSIVINIADDAPIANDDAATIAQNQSQISGNVVTNDDPGNDAAAHVTSVRFNGTDYPVVQGTPTVINGQYGTLTINADGAYTYKSFGTNTAAVKDVFTYTLTDFDGDSDTANLTINIADIDDKPILANVKPLTVDETDLNPTDSDGNIVNANFGHDGPGTYTVTGLQTISFNGAKNGALTSNGVPVTIAIVGNSYVGTAGGQEIFRLDLNKDTGRYDFTLKGTLDHADITNPDDTIQIKFGVTATDTDGDTDQGLITVNIKDDGPVAHDDFNSYDANNGGATGNVITGLNGGPNAADELSKDSGPDEAHDHDIVKISFGATTVNVPAGGSATIEGNNGFLEIFDNGDYTYTLKPGALTYGTGGAIDFIETLEFPVLVEGQAISGDALNNLGILDGTLNFTQPVQGSVQFVSEGAGYNNTLGAYTITADGTIFPASIILENGNTATTSDIYTFNAQQGQSIGFFIIAEGYDVNNSYNNIDFNNGKLEFIYKYGTADERPANVNDNGNDINLVFTNGTTGAETILNGPIYHTTERGGSESINADNSIRIVSGLADDTDNTVLRIGFEDLPALGDKDYQDVIFDITLKPILDCVMDEFQYVLQDGDGDTSTATLELCGKDITDYNPVIISTKPLTVDETDLNPTDSDSSTIIADFGGDTLDSYTVTGLQTISFNGAKNGALTSNGVPVTIAIVGNSYVGTAGGQEIFRLDINKDTGRYDFTLKGTLDHADITNPDDIIQIKFGVTATDTDGDTDKDFITVNIKDDGPVAHDDDLCILTGYSKDGGNVIVNDDQGSDIKATVTSVNFNGTDYAVVPGTSTIIDGAHGTLNIKADGSYIYSPFGTNSTEVEDVFVYTLTDADGDSDTANLTICVEPNIPPSVDVNVNNGIDEVCVKEDGQITVPVTATINGGNGNEVVTLILTGVDPNWGLVSGTGWTKQADGSYQITLAAGQNYNGGLSFTPAPDSDVDLTGLTLTASLQDPDTNQTTTGSDSFFVTVDAVADAPGLVVNLPVNSGYTRDVDGIPVTQWNYEYSGDGSSDSFYVRSFLNDTDGSETITHYTIEIPKALADFGVTFSAGTQTTPGLWDIQATDIDGLQIIFPSIPAPPGQPVWSNPDYTIPEGFHNFKVTVYSEETNLSGAECDPSDNIASTTHIIQVVVAASPLVLDLDGDGIELVHADNGVLFDMTNDGILDKTGWVKGDDGLLALDANKDGLINNKSELFGNNELYADGFANLASYDDNHDGLIDAKDAVWNELTVWQDKNQDGISDADELQSLDDAGITSISLDAQETQILQDGNRISHESTFTKADGSTGEIVDAWFGLYNGATDTIPESTGMQTLPDDEIALDISGVIEDFDALQNSINDFVFATQSDAPCTADQTCVPAFDMALAQTGISLDLEDASNNQTTL